MNILFLDIDGVMIPTRNYFTSKYRNQFDPLAVEAVKAICGRCNAQVVTNTSWNNSLHLNELWGLLIKNEIPIASQWHTEYARGSIDRLDAIEEWIRDYGEEGMLWACLDDDDDLRKKDHSKVVTVDSDLGITPEVYTLATYLLGKEDLFMIIV